MSKSARAAAGPAGLACLLAGIPLWAVGCGADAPFPLAAVEGTVTYQGKPLDRGRVVFFPTGGTPGPTAVGTIGPDGTFRVLTLGRDGASLGRHRVTVHLCEQLTDEQARQREGIPLKSLIPERYANPDTSGLLIDVQKGENVYRIELLGPA
jgi:hypothetical protein